MDSNPISTAELIALGLVPGAGRKTIYQALRFLQRSGMPLRACLETPLPALLSRGAPGEEKALESMDACGQTQLAEAESVMKLCKKAGIRMWSCLDAGYPPFLRMALADQAPTVLFYQGNESLLHEAGAAVVGTRRPTESGLAWTQAAARHWADAGITVISGGAAGVDMEAHTATLRADGTTVVVLPEGLHGYHPPPAIRRGLANGQVLLLSEFLPSADWQTHRAMTRNRTIAACSRVVCVIEPRVKSGSAYTAEQALAQEKSVFFWSGAGDSEAIRKHDTVYPLVQAGQLNRRMLDDVATSTFNIPRGQGELF